MGMAECPTCHKELDTESGMKKHHAHVHGTSLTQKTWSCTWCDETFTRPESQIQNTERVFCSKKCHGKWIHENDHTRVQVTCEYCDSQFERRKNKLPPRNHYFCSHECHGKWKKQQGTVVVSCEICDTEVTKNIAYANRCEHHFCSTECQGTWYSENIRGEDHPLWKGGSVSYYGKTWLPQRRAALKRDEYACQDCGLTREEHYKQHGADLEVHHIQPFRTFEDSATANQLSNLITVCTTCHLQRENSTE